MKPANHALSLNWTARRNTLVLRSVNVEMSHVTTITCVTNVGEGYVQSAREGSAFPGGWVFLGFTVDMEGILAAVPVDQSFVGMFTPLGKSQYVASTFATMLKIPTMQEQRFCKCVASEVNSMGPARHYMFFNGYLDPGELPYKKDEGTCRFHRG